MENIIAIHRLFGFEKRKSQKNLKIWADFSELESVECYFDDDRNVYKVELQFKTGYHEIRFLTEGDAQDFIDSVLDGWEIAEKGK